MDYGVRDFTREGMKIHLILDGPVNHSLDQIEGALKESVHYVAFGFSMESILIGPWKSFRTEKKLQP